MWDYWGLLYYYYHGSVGDTRLRSINWVLWAFRWGGEIISIIRDSNSYRANIVWAKIVMKMT